MLSTVGYYGKPVADTAQKLLKNKMIDFTGSDIHHKNHVHAFYKEMKIKESENNSNSLNQPESSNQNF